MLNEFFKFAVVGGLGTIINLIIFTTFNLIGFHYIISAILSFLVAVSFNFILNSIWVFKKRNTKINKNSAIKFFIISVISLIINLIILNLSEKFLIPSLSKYSFIQNITFFIKNITKIETIKTIYNIYSQCLGIGCAMIFNFIGNNLFTFKK